MNNRVETCTRHVLPRDNVVLGHDTGNLVESTMNMIAAKPGVPAPKQLLNYSSVFLVLAHTPKNVALYSPCFICGTLTKCVVHCIPHGDNDMIALSPLDLYTFHTYSAVNTQYFVVSRVVYNYRSVATLYIPSAFTFCMLTEHVRNEHRPTISYTVSSHIMTSFHDVLSKMCCTPLAAFFSVPIHIRLPRWTLIVSWEKKHLIPLKRSRKTPS